MSESAEIPQSSHIIPSHEDIPFGENTIQFNQGHTGELRKAKLVEDNDLYYIEGQKNPFSSIKIDTFVKNKTLQDNTVIPYAGVWSGDIDRKMPAQDVLFEIVHQEIGQSNVLSNLESLQESVGKLPSKYIESKLSNFEQDIEMEYFGAQAGLRLLDQLEGPETDKRLTVREKANKLLTRNEGGQIVSLDEKKSLAKNLVENIRQKLN